MEKSSPSPRIVHLDELRDAVDERVVLRIPGSDWKRMLDGAIDGGRGKVPFPKYGPMLMARPLHPVLVQPPPKGDLPPPDPPPRGPDVLLDGYCECEDDGYCGLSVDYESMRITCECVCPPDIDLPDPDPPPPCALTFTRAQNGLWGLDCVGACPPGKTCRRVYWPFTTPAGQMIGIFLRCDCVT